MDYVRDLGDRGAFDEAEARTAAGASAAPEGVPEEELENDDRKEEDTISQYGEEKEALHEEEGQPFAESQSGASASVELSQTGDVGQHKDYTFDDDDPDIYRVGPDYVYPCFNNYSPPLSKQSDVDKESTPKKM
jgi:hypothetical protein